MQDFFHQQYCCWIRKSYIWRLQKPHTIWDFEGPSIRCGLQVPCIQPCSGKSPTNSKGWGFPNMAGAGMKQTNLQFFSQSWVGWIWRTISFWLEAAGSVGHQGRWRVILDKSTPSAWSAWRNKIIQIRCEMLVIFFFLAQVGSKSCKDRVVGPLPNGRTSWLSSWGWS